MARKPHASPKLVEAKWMKVTGVFAILSDDENNDTIVGPYDTAQHALEDPLVNNVAKVTLVLGRFSATSVIESYKDSPEEV